MENKILYMCKDMIGNTSKFALKTLLCSMNTYDNFVRILN